MKVTLYGERLDTVVNALSKYLGTDGKVTNLVEETSEQQCNVFLREGSDLSVEGFLQDIAREYKVTFEIQKSSLGGKAPKDDLVPCAYLVW